MRISSSELKFLDCIGLGILGNQKKVENLVRPTFIKSSKVIVSQRNVNQISYISILQFGENYGLGHKGEMGFSSNRSFNNNVVKILRLFNLWELAFWHHLTLKDYDFVLHLLKYLWGYLNYYSA